MSALLTSAAVALLAAASSANAYFLTGSNNILSTQRMDPIVNPGYGRVAGHAHTILGGSNFKFDTTTDGLRQSQCTTIPINEDKSNYWFPSLYFQWKNGSFSEVSGGAVIYYLYSNEKGKTTPFPDNFRMISGDPSLRSFNASSHAQQAVTFLCLDFNGVTTRHNELPAKACPSGVRAQINFPSCWDGKNTDSKDHKSHMAFLSGGPDSGTCSDPNFPVVVPRIFMEFYTETAYFDKLRGEAKNPNQPFVYAMGDPTGYGYHADFVMGWDKGVLQRVVDECNCDNSGSPQCCADKGLFTLDTKKACRITPSFDERVNGQIATLPGNNPVQGPGPRAQSFANNVIPRVLEPVFVYTGANPTQTGKPQTPGSGPVDVPPVVSSSSQAAPSSVVAAPSSSAAVVVTSTAINVPVSTPILVVDPTSAAPVASSSPPTESVPAPSASAPVLPPAPSVPSPASSVSAPSESSTPHVGHGHGHHGHDNQQQGTTINPPKPASPAPGKNNNTDAEDAEDEEDQAVCRQTRKAARASRRSHRRSHHDHNSHRFN